MAELVSESCDHQCDHHPPSDGFVYRRVYEVAPRVLEDIITLLDVLSTADQKRIVNWLTDLYVPSRRDT